MEERNDFFGKYFEKMNEIHMPIMKQVISQLDLDLATGQFDIIQCNFAEYLEHHPEEPKYFFELYNFDFEGSSKPFLFAFNTYFFKSRTEVQQLVDSISSNWRSLVKAKINFIEAEKSIYDLNLAKYDMLQTIHYLYPQKNLIKDNIDYQMFKVIYPYDTLKPVLDYLK